MYSHSEISFTDFNDVNQDEEILLTDEGSEIDPIGMEVLEAPMFNLMLNIYNQESGHEFKGYLYELLPLMV